MKQKEFEQAKEAFGYLINIPEVPLEELRTIKLFFGSETVQNLIEFGRQNNELIYPIVEFLGDALSANNGYRANLCRYLIGVYAESGYATETTDHKLMQCFSASVKECYGLLQNHCLANEIGMQDYLNDPEAYPLNVDGLLPEHKHAVYIWYAMPLLTLGVMSRISEQRTLRDLLRQDTGLRGACEVLNVFLGNVGFVPTVLNMVENETVLFLSPQKELGYEVSLQEVDSNFLMFTLFQYALYHAGELEALGVTDYSYDPLIEKVALHIPLNEGESFPEHLSDKSCFGYHPCTAWQVDGSLASEDMVWGEGTLYEIPKVDGHFVILLGIPQVTRLWSNAFIASTHSHLRPRLVIEHKLTPDEVQRWILRIQNSTLK